MVRSSSMELDRMEDENPEMGSQYFDTGEDASKNFRFDSFTNSHRYKGHPM